MEGLLKRTILSLLAGSLAGAACAPQEQPRAVIGPISAPVAAANHEAGRLQVSVKPQYDLPATPTPYPTPEGGYDSSPNGILLQQTAEALQYGQDTQFVPTAQITQELFDQTRAGTLALRFFDKDGYSVGVCTGWVPQTEDSGLYIVTADHCLKSATHLWSWRPGIDKTTGLHPIIGRASDPQSDLAVFKVQASPSFAQRYSRLPWADSLTPQEGLMVGYPAAFIVVNPDTSLPGGQDFLTFGKTLRLEPWTNNPDSPSNLLVAKGVVSGGSSGSPVVAPGPDGPLAFGITISKIEDLQDPQAIVSPLNLRPLLETIR
ncbi:hypothetical protein A2160_01865 [Candidatus Beckwithbacteria bacterium RBG_13_42_9]|uniref:Serine protease n=1 Tax=Candidatus Beckwithbacteria bacterium RBG_13_42_9 TaxID=1797457 RepID=A0A1F5E8A5_9BACT|nr:MAG: hypothetical protein A2160_01865 [Candidatus Beckwithbacteria bacterium RBG_13_42_9]